MTENRLTHKNSDSPAQQEAMVLRHAAVKRLTELFM